MALSYRDVQAKYAISHLTLWLFNFILSFFLSRKKYIDQYLHEKNLHFFPVAGSRIKRKLGLLAQGLPTVTHGPHVPFFAQILQVTTEVSPVQLSTSNMHLFNQGINSTILIHSSISILWNFECSSCSLKNRYAWEKP